MGALYRRFGRERRSYDAALQFCYTSAQKRGVENESVPGEQRKYVGAERQHSITRGIYYAGSDWAGPIKSTYTLQLLMQVYVDLTSSIDRLDLASPVRVSIVIRSQIPGVKHPPERPPKT